MTGPFGYPSFAHRPCPTAEALAAPDYAVTAHAEAAAKLLCQVVRELRQGRTPEELGERVSYIGQMMERRT